MPTACECDAADVWFREAKFPGHIDEVWRRGTFSSAAPVRVAQRSGLVGAQEEALRTIDREVHAPGRGRFPVSEASERLVVPEPVCRIWPEVLGVLRHTWPVEAGLPRWCMTGATVLCARWRGHRRSTDIDSRILPRLAGGGSGCAACQPAFVGADVEIVCTAVTISSSLGAPRGAD